MNRADGGIPGQVYEKPRQVIEGHPLRSADIEDAGSPAFRRQDISLDDIPNKGKITALFAIAEDDRLPAC
jgi:hypothetical protein